jgi:uncharacterized protein (TIGR03083 family)
MAASSVWPLIHGERAALAADLAGLTDEQWATASLCPGWSVRDVLGHLTATAKMTPGAFFVHLAQARFRFHDMSDQLIAAEATAVPGDGLTEFRKHLDDTTHPPGPVGAMLGEAVVHGEDIRRPRRKRSPGRRTSSRGRISSSAASAGSPDSACGPTTSSGRPAAAPR